MTNPTPAPERTPSAEDASKALRTLDNTVMAHSSSQRDNIDNAFATLRAHLSALEAENAEAESNLSIAWAATLRLQKQYANCREMLARSLYRSGPLTVLDAERIAPIGPELELVETRNAMDNRTTYSVRVAAALTQEPSNG